MIMNPGSDKKWKTAETTQQLGGQQNKNYRLWSKTKEACPQVERLVEGADERC